MMIGIIGMHKDGQVAINPGLIKLASPNQPTFEGLALSYPLIFRAYLHPGQYPAYSIAERKFECGLGWYAIIDELSAWLERWAQGFQTQGSERIPVVAQCKEKFGSLRYYVREIPDDRVFRIELRHQIEMAYARSCCTSEFEA